MSNLTQSICYEGNIVVTKAVLTQDKIADSRSLFVEEKTLLVLSNIVVHCTQIFPTERPHRCCCRSSNHDAVGDSMLNEFNVSMIIVAPLPIFHQNHGESGTIFPVLLANQKSDPALP